MYSVLLVSVALLFLVSGIIKFVRRERGQTFPKFFLTVLVWGGVLFFAIFPDSSHALSIAFGLGENLNTLIFIGFVTVFMVIFRLLSIIERLERNISELVRKEALKEIVFEDFEELDKG